ncbi:hypothetical protein SEVIR_2G423950v4 [Setaria viridis]
MSFMEARSSISTYLQVSTDPTPLSFLMIATPPPSLAPTPARHLLCRDVWRGHSRRLNSRGFCGAPPHLFGMERATATVLRPDESRRTPRFTSSSVAIGNAGGQGRGRRRTFLRASLSA